jgi:hypothetical protein
VHVYIYTPISHVDQVMLVRLGLTEAKESKEDSVTFRFKILSMESHKAVKTMEFTAPVEVSNRTSVSAEAACE